MLNNFLRDEKQNVKQLMALSTKVEYTIDSFKESKNYKLLIGNRQLNFSAHIMRKENLENLTLTRNVGSKRKLRTTCLTSLNK